MGGSAGRNRSPSESCIRPRNSTTCPSPHANETRLESEPWASRSPLSSSRRRPPSPGSGPVLQQSRSTYTAYLLSHPSDSLVDPVRELPLMVAPSSARNDLQALPLAFYQPKGYRQSLPTPVVRLLYYGNGRLVLAWAGLSCLVAIAFAAMRLTAVEAFVPLICLLSTVPHAMIVWNGDPLGAGLLLVVLSTGPASTIVFVADAFLSLEGHQAGLGAAGLRSCIPHFSDLRPHVAAVAALRLPSRRRPASPASARLRGSWMTVSFVTPPCLLDSPT